MSLLHFFVFIGVLSLAPMLLAQSINPSDPPAQQKKNAEKRMKKRMKEFVEKIKRIHKLKSKTDLELHKELLKVYTEVREIEQPFSNKKLGWPTGAYLGKSSLFAPDCLSLLEGFSQNGIGLGASQLLITKADYSLTYSYNTKTKIKSPILIKTHGDEVTVITPRGTSKTTGTSCNVVSRETSTQVLSESIANSKDKLDELLNTNRKGYKSQRSELVKGYKKILTACSESKNEAISTAAKKALTSLEGTATGGRSSRGTR